MPNKKRTKLPIQSKPTVVVAMGASAGSVKILKSIVAKFGDRKRVAYVLAQHLDEAGKNLAYKALKSASPLPVREVQEGLKIEPGFLYWVPPHTTVNIRKGCFETSPAKTIEQRLAIIDHLFSGIANEFRHASVGVVLSGNGSDGALGLKAINEAGGLTIAQNPKSAEHSSMPESAIALGAVDHVVDPEKIALVIEQNATYISQFTGSQNESALKEQILAAIAPICEILQKHTQQDFKHYKTSTLVRRIQRRMHVLHVDSVETYVERLAKGKEEAEALFRELLINVTAFFRDPLAFEVLQQEVLRKLLQQARPEQKIRIWVAGCATGEEAYSIAISICELFGQEKRKPEVQIIATDIDPHALSIARKGSYPISVADHIPSEYLAKYFTKRGGKYHVTKQLRELCLFSIHNLISDPPFSQIDLISCRNVLIYLGAHLQKKLFPVFHYSLKKNGYLFLGTSESLTSHKELFKVVHVKHRIAQKKATAIRLHTQIPSSINSYLNHFQDLPRDTQPDMSLISQRIALDEIPLKYAVVNEDGHIISASAGISKYAEIGEGLFQNSIVKLAKPSLRPALRKAFASAKEHKRKVVDEASSLKTETGLERVGIIVQPMPQLGEESNLYWIAFHYLGTVSTRDLGLVRTPDAQDSDLIDQLEKEVFVLREELDKSVQDLEASNEELKSSNEELLSMNEELQSANEEMETSKEELQMVNEALQKANADLENLLAGTQIATLFLDRDLKIRAFTPAINELYRVQSNDIGRDIRDFNSYAFAMPPYPTEVIDDPVEDEVRSQSGQIFLRRILPYRNYENMKEGIVVTFLDVTNIRALEMQYKELADSMPNIIWTTDEKGVTDYCNQRWYDFTGFDKSLTLEENWLPILHPDDARIYVERFAEAFKTGKIFEMEYRLWDRQHTTYRWFLGRAVPVRDQNGTLKKWIGSAVDIDERVKAEDARRQSDKLLQLVTDIAPVLIWISNTEMKRTFFNKGWVDFVGQNLESSLGDGWKKFVHPVDLPKFMDMYTQHFASKTPFYIEYRLRNQSGEYRWIGARGVPRIDANGEFQGFIGACIDIHEQRSARETLIENERRLDTLIRSSPTFMCVLRGKNHVFETVNEQYKQLIGHRDVIGKTLLEGLPEIKNQGFNEILDRVLETGEPYVGAEVRVELQRTPNGPLESRYVDFVYQPHTLGADRTEAVLVHGVDVTDKVDARAFIENERANFRNLFKQTPEMVCILSGPEHRFEFVNEAHVRVLGFDATGKTVRQAQPESVEVHTILDDVFRTGITAELHEIPITVTDRLRYFNLTYAARRDLEGEIDGIMILGTEVTEEVLRRTELQDAKREAEVANTSKSRFLANMSHEIRTPLSAIVGFSELLYPKLTEDKTANSYIERISRNATQLGRLIDELLDLSKIEADKLEIEKIPVDVDNIIEDLYSTMALRAEDKGLVLDFKWETEKPARIIADPIRLSQILINLVGNAVKFTEHGSVQVRFRVKNEKLTVLIKDTGIGLNEEQQKRIFEPFMQADTSVSRKYGGTGLGLVLAKKLANLMDGDVVLEQSKPGMGTTFRVEVPVIGSNRNTAHEKASAQATPLPPVSLTGKTVLVVDDSHDNRMIVSLFLNSVGAETLEAVNGEEGVKMALELKPDLVLMDIQMPVMDGYQALAQFKKVGFRAPIFALTAHALKEERDRCLALGFTGYITKPVNRLNLQKIVNDALEIAEIEK